MKGHDHNLTVKKVERPSPTVVHLHLEFQKETLKNELEATAHRFSHQAKLPGFRPGKAPLNMVRARYKDDIHKETVSHLIEAGVREAVEQTKLSPVSQPQVKLTQVPEEAEKALQFEVEFEVTPEIELRRYKGIPVKVQKEEPEAGEVARTLETIRERLAVLEPSSDTKASKGLYGVVEVSFEVKEEGRKEPGKPFTIELGTGQLIKDVDEAVLEMSVGETKIVQGKFPEDYPEKTVAGKTAEFTCRLIELKKKNLPELNDEMAGTLKAGQTLESLTQEVSKTLREAKKVENRKAQRREVVDYLVAQNQFDVPKSLVEQQARNLLQWMVEDMQRRGARQFPKLEDKDVTEIRRQAEQMVKSSLLLKEIAVKEKISLDEKRVQDRIDGVASEMKTEKEEAVRALETKGLLTQIREEILTDQVFEFLLQHAQVVEKSPR